MPLILVAPYRVRQPIVNGNPYEFVAQGSVLGLTALAANAESEVFISKTSILSLKAQVAQEGEVIIAKSSQLGLRAVSPR